MDVLQLLKKDHKRVKALVAEFESLSERASQKKSSLAAQICQALTVHAHVEEEFVYPALYAVRAKELTKVLDEAAEEHQVAKTLIAELMEMPSHEARYDAKVTVLGEYVLHHVKEEEKEMFPLAKQHLSEEKLAALGKQVEARRSELMEEEEDGDEKTLREEAAEEEREDEQIRAEEDAEDIEDRDMERRRGGRQVA